MGACLLASLMTGCAAPKAHFELPFFHHKAAPTPTPAPLTHQPPKPKPSPKRTWTGDGVQGPAEIKIHLSEQRAFFYKGKQLVGETDISSGRDGYDTPPGRYEVIQKDKDHRSTLYGEFVDGSGNVVKSNVDITKQSPPPGCTFQGAKMPYFLRFRSGYGLHAGVLPGHRASHGCVRLPRSMAEHFFDNASVGTPVVVEP
jgi:lipoprotein-anchoring transpeptidase ErfK/SrfK